MSDKVDWKLAQDWCQFRTSQTARVVVQWYGEKPTTADVDRLIETMTLMRDAFPTLAQPANATPTTANLEGTETTT